MQDLISVVLLTCIVMNILLFSIQIPILTSKHKRERVLDIAYALVLEAEKAWGGDTGAIKRAQVKAKLYITVSTLAELRPFLRKKTAVDSIIDEAIARKDLYVAEHGEIVSQYKK